MRITGLLLAGVALLGASSVATAADLIVEPPPEMMYDPEPVGNWDGPYIGVFGGYGWGLADHTGPFGPCIGTGIPAGSDGCDVLMSGGILGLVAGANFSLTNSIVGGVAADIAWTNISGTDIFPVLPGDDSSTHNVNFEGSVRGVLGFDAGAFMPYLTAGLAVANADHTNFLSDTVSVTHFGGTFGAGVQIAVADNIALDLQARTSIYNEHEYDHGAAPNNPNFALATSRVTAGLNIRF